MELLPRIRAEFKREYYNGAKGAEALLCDGCHKHIGWVRECDLNGSVFFCDQCKNECEGNPAPPDESRPYVPPSYSKQEIRMDQIINLDRL